MIPRLLIVACMLVTASGAQAQQYSGRLYPGAAPGSETWLYDGVSVDSEGYLP